MQDQECRWCGKTHKAEHCFHVREIEYFEDGTTPKRVVFENGQQGAILSGPISEAVQSEIVKTLKSEVAKSIKNFIEK